MNRRYQTKGNLRRSVRIALGMLLAAATTLGDVACSDDDLTDASQYPTGELRTGTLEISMDPAVIVERTRGAGDEVAWDAAGIDHVWIGVFETSTKRLIGAQRSDRYVEGRDSKNPTFDLNKQSEKPVRINFVYNDNDRKIFAVGLANYSGIKAYRTTKVNEKGERLDLDEIKDESEWPNGDEMVVDDLLDEIKTWHDFLAISIDVESAEKVAQETGYRIMSNLVSSSKTQNPYTAGSASDTYNGKIYGKTNGRESDNDDDNGDEQITLSNDYSSTRVTGYLYLRRFLSHNKVNVIGEEGKVKISNVRYNVFNVPKRTYLQEHTTPGNGNRFDDVSDWRGAFLLSANAADWFGNFTPEGSEPQPPYYGDLFPEKQAASSNGNNGYSFEFSHYDNKHWGISGSCTTYLHREKKFDGTNLYSSLCPEVSDWFYNYASYIQIYATVTDLTTGYTADATYTIHEGYASSVQYGNLTGAKAPDDDSQRSRDFQSLRNTNYTYNVTISGLKSIEVLVGIDEEGTPHPAVTGRIISIEHDIDEELASDLTVELNLTDAQRKELYWRIYTPKEDPQNGNDFGTIEDQEGLWDELAEAYPDLWRDHYGVATRVVPTDYLEGNSFYNAITITPEGGAPMSIAEFANASNETDNDNETLRKYTVKLSSDANYLVGTSDGVENTARFFYCYTKVAYTQSEDEAYNYKPLFVIKQYPPILRLKEPRIEELSFGNTISSLPPTANAEESSLAALQKYLSSVNVTMTPSLSNDPEESQKADRYVFYVDDVLIDTKDVADVDGETSLELTAENAALGQLSAGKHTLTVYASMIDGSAKAANPVSMDFYVYPTNMTWKYSAPITSANTSAAPFVYQNELSHEAPYYGLKLGSDVVLDSDKRFKLDGAYNPTNNGKYLQFTALHDGVVTVQVAASGASARDFVVFTNGTEKSETLNSTNPVTHTFNVNAGDVMLYAKSSTQYVYEVKFEYMTIWDFSSKLWQNVPLSTSTDATVDGLKIYAGGKAFSASDGGIKVAGAGSETQCHFKFDAPCNGKLYVTAFEQNRPVRVYNGGTYTQQNTVSKTTELQWDIQPGNVIICSGSGGITFYKIRFVPN